jgi:manganese transport protein
VMHMFKKKNPGQQHWPQLTAIDFLKYIGPGFLVTIGFIDPGNWATNIAAGSRYGYTLLWVITLSTVMLMVLQHNAAHLGIATGQCLSEAATAHFPGWLSRPLLGSAVIAAIATALAEITGAAIALQMIFNLPLKIGSTLSAAFVAWMLFTNSYKKLEKWIIGFVSLIGVSFIFELCLIRVPWKEVLFCSFKPVIPPESMPFIMGVLGAVVMPHNLFLHSEIIQSRRINAESEAMIDRALKYEFLDTTVSMITGWAINSAIIILTAALFFNKGMPLTQLEQARQMLTPILGNAASLVFAFALLMSGISSSVTAGMAGGSIFSGIFSEPYDIQDHHTKIGVILTFLPALLVTFFITDTFKGLIASQILLSVQLPLTIVGLVVLTSSKKVMGKYSNSPRLRVLLWAIGGIVIGLNVMLLRSML